MGIFKRDFTTEEMMKGEILFAVTTERKRLQDESASQEEDEQHCKNIKLLAEAYAAIDGR